MAKYSVCLVYYDSHEAYLMALADALANEYREIYAAGLVLQIDSPDPPPA